jgi:hypothetical protein
VWRTMRKLLGQVFPCWAFAENNVDAVLASHTVEHAGKTGGVHSVFRCLLSLYQHRTVMLFVMLRHLPDEFALDMRVIVQQMMSQNTNAHVQQHTIVRLDSCGMSAANLGEWFNLLVLCRRLVLVDCNLDAASLRKLSRWLNNNSTSCFGALDVFARKKNVHRLRTLDFVSTNSVTPDVAVALLQMVLDCEKEFECTLGARREFRFSEKLLQRFCDKTYQSYKDFLHALKHDLRAVSSRSCDHWDDLRDAFTRLQLRQYKNLNNDMALVVKNASTMKVYCVLVSLGTDKDLYKSTRDERKFDFGYVD